MSKEYGSIQFLLEPADAAKVLRVAVDEADFSPKGRETEPHITVLWGLLPSVTAEEISAITAGIGEVNVTIGDFELFPVNPLGVPFIIKWESEKLVKLHDDLNRLLHVQVHPTYRPHIAVAYLQEDKAEKYRGRVNALRGQVFTLRNLVYSSADNTVTVLEKKKKKSDFVPVTAIKKADEPAKYDGKKEAAGRDLATFMASYAEKGRFFDPKGNYLCQGCNQFVKEQTLCMTVGEPGNDFISGKTGSCRYWEVIDKNRDRVVLEKKFTKQEAGYTERPNLRGFGCKRCDFGSEAKKKDPDGRPSWCSFWAMHVLPKACCGENQGPDDNSGTDDIKVQATDELSKPYASADDAPSYVPKSKRKQWIAVWNSAYNRAIKDGKDAKDAESSAFAQANAVAGPNSEKAYAKLMRKADEEEAREFVELLMSEMQRQFENLPVEVQTPLENATLSGVAHGMLQIDIGNAGLLRTANQQAHDYAVDRAAEMIGMKRDEEGNLVENPNAKWVISDTTRDKIRQIVADAFTEETPLAEIKDAIREALEEETQGNGIFSDGRADMIARTEVANSQIHGQVEVWRQSGIVKKVKWLTSQDEGVCPRCEGNDNIEVEFLKPFPSGDLYPTAHPWCRCVIVVTQVHSE